MYEYLGLILVFTLPFLVYGLRRKGWRGVLLRVALSGTVIGGVWDLVAVHGFGLWYWREEGIIGLWVLGIPVEEWLFFPLVSVMIATITLMLKERSKL